MFWLIVRLVMSLAFVAGLLWMAARMAGKRGLGASAGAVEVLARQPLTRSSAVMVVRVADRVLILGASDQQVTLLGETDLESVESSVQVASDAKTFAPSGLGTGAISGVMGGSVLDPAQWRSTINGFRDLTVRRK